MMDTDDQAPRTIIVPGMATSLEDTICPKCPLYQRKLQGQCVQGSGSRTPRLIFIGEAPGENEVRQGKPFVGRAGSVLNDSNLSIGLLREDAYFTNAVKCRPANNETPPTEAVQLCRNFLEQELRQFADQDVKIVTLGNIPLRSATQDYRKTITKSRAKWVDLQIPGISFKAMPTFHPAYILRNPNMARFMEDDIRRALNSIGLVDPLTAVVVPEGSLIERWGSDSYEKVKEIFNSEDIILDIETNNQLNPRVPGSKITMIGLYNKQRKFLQLGDQCHLLFMREFLPAYPGMVIGHNLLQFDFKWLRYMAVPIPMSIKVYDTLYAWKLFDDNRPDYSLASAARELNYPDYKSLYDKEPRLYNLYDLMVTRSLFDFLYQSGVRE